jgi:tripartite-type tricarboxylate transporter receptor subunit TctC
MSLKSMNRKTFLGLAFALAQSAASLALAQSPGASYPERPVKLIVPFAPGAGTDAMGRLVAQKLGEVLGRQFRGREQGGRIGRDRHPVRRAAACRWLHPAAGGLTVHDRGGVPAHRRIRPAAAVCAGGHDRQRSAGLGRQRQPARQQHARTGQSGQAEAGRAELRLGRAGGVNHLVLELLKSKTGTFITHIPYRGVAPATMDMIAGQVQLVTGTIPALLPFIKDGRVKALAVTSAKRSKALPDVPSMTEAGYPGIDVVNFFAIMAPIGTPPAVIEKLNQAINKLVLMPDVAARFKVDAVEAAPGSPALLGHFIEADYRAWRNVVSTQNLKITE